jgi:hypothetical protein
LPVTEYPKNPAARESMMAFCNELIAAAEAGNGDKATCHLPMIRTCMADYYEELMAHAGDRPSLDQLRGFLNGLVVAQRLTPEQGHAFMQRVNAGAKGEWL